MKDKTSDFLAYVTVSILFVAIAATAGWGAAWLFGIHLSWAGFFFAALSLHFLYVSLPRGGRR